MKKHALIETAFVVILLAATSAFAGVTVSSPSNGSTVGTSVNFVASGSTSCSKGVASRGVYPSAGWLVYTVGGLKLSTNINLNPGTYSVVVQEWDYWGGASTTTVKINVQSGSGVHLNSPSNNSSVGSPVNFVATATTNCSEGVASMGIYTRALSIGIRSWRRQLEQESFAGSGNLSRDRRGVG